jgi:hypothetical protein
MNCHCGVVRSNAESEVEWLVPSLRRPSCKYDRQKKNSKEINWPNIDIRRRIGGATSGFLGTQHDHHSKNKKKISSEAPARSAIEGWLILYSARNGWTKGRKGLFKIRHAFGALSLHPAREILCSDSGGPKHVPVCMIRYL